MQYNQITDLTVAQLGAHIESRTISPVDVAQAFLNRIDVLEPTLNAFISRVDEHALKVAHDVEKDISRGHYRGAWHGIPVGLKDLFWTKGIRTTSGSQIDRDFVPQEDAAVFNRLVKAGAYCIGKLHMTEYAFDGTSLNYHYGTAHNPWDTTRMAGGSSSGSGVAVASGQVPIALGTDTGGSVRVPASLCGITGFKPTFGLISRYGVTPLSWSMDHVGPLTKTVHDAAIAINVMAGYDNRDPYSVRRASIDYLSGLDNGMKGVRVGVPREFIWDMLDPEVDQAFRTSLSQMESLGAVIEYLSVPALQLVNASGSVVQTAEAATIHRSHVLKQGHLLDPVIRRRIESGMFISAEAYLHAQQVRTKLRNELLTVMDQVDLIATPTTSIVAPYIDQEQVIIKGQSVSVREALLRITRVFSTVGFPAISVPCGFTKGKLPIGLQIVGKPLGEVLLLQAAHAYQKSTQWHLRKPDIMYLL